MLTLWFCLLAALPPDEVDGLAVTAEASGWASVTYALQRPPTAADEGVLLARLPGWDAAFGFTRYAVPLATPTAGGDLAEQLDQLARLAGAVGPDRLVAVTPTVGTAGWEASHNLGWLPLGGQAALVATERDPWLEQLGSAAVRWIALSLDNLATEPTPEQLGDYLDAFLARCAATGQQAELWLPAVWASAETPSPLLAVLTPERVLACRRVIWTDVEQQLPAPALTMPEADTAAPLPVSGGVETAPETKLEPVAEPAEVTIKPTALQAGQQAAAVLGPLADRTPRGLAGVDLVDSPRRPLVRIETAEEYLGTALQAGFGHLVVRGRLDTPQAPLWRELMIGLTTP